MKRAALIVALLFSGCCSGEVAKSARMFANDLQVYVAASKARDPNAADAHARAGAALVRHASELAELAEGESR